MPLKEYLLPKCGTNATQITLNYVFFSLRFYCSLRLRLLFVCSSFHLRVTSHFMFVFLPVTLDLSLPTIYYTRTIHVQYAIIGPSASSTLCSSIALPYANGRKVRAIFAIFTYKIRKCFQSIPIHCRRKSNRFGNRKMESTILKQQNTCTRSVSRRQCLVSSQNIHLRHTRVRLDSSSNSSSIANREHTSHSQCIQNFVR